MEQLQYNGRSLSGVSDAMPAAWGRPRLDRRSLLCCSSLSSATQHQNSAQRQPKNRGKKKAAALDLSDEAGGGGGGGAGDAVAEMPAHGKRQRKPSAKAAAAAAALKEEPDEEEQGGGAAKRARVKKAPSGTKRAAKKEPKPEPEPAAAAAAPVAPSVTATATSSSSDASSSFAAQFAASALQQPVPSLPPALPPPPPMSIPAMPSFVPTHPARPTHQVEKRPARLRNGNAEFNMRMARALSQRMFLLSHKDESAEGNLAHSFIVLGSTGNTYTIRISALPSCNCPDFQRKMIACKHVIFVYLRVLKLAQNHIVLPQKGLLQSELADIFQRLPGSRAEEAAALRGVLANERAVSAYKREMGEEVEDDSQGKGGGKGEKGAAAAAEEAEEEEEKEEEELMGDVDECPICFEGIDAKNKAARAQLAVCLTCRRPAGHKVCFSHWTTSRRRDGHSVSCVWCRADWVDATEAKAAAAAGGGGGGVPGVKRDRGGYINLAAYTGQSARRDTSTYYSRGGRYGWAHWDDDGDY